jgi:endoglucanase Acf2
MPPAVSFAVGCTALLFLILSPVNAQVVQVGKGSYTTSGSFAVTANTPSVIPNFPQKVICAKWWVTLINKQFSDNMYAHPLSFKTAAGGLEIGYPGAAGLSGNDINSQHSRDVFVGVAGLNASQTAVAAYSHFGVTARWLGAGAASMDATMNQGIPFAYFKITGGNATITFGGNPTIWYNQGGVVGATTGGKNFALFAPSGSTWSGTGTMTSSLNGKDYLSVALLPDNTEKTLLFFKQYAYSFAIDTRVSWVYNESSAMLTSIFGITASVKEGAENGTVFALLRHQWLSYTGPLTDYTYQSARGVMKVVSGPSFATNMRFNGALLSMPDTGFDMNTLKTQVQSEGVPASIGGSTYNKDLGKHAQLAQLAEVVGNTTKRDQIVNMLKTSLQNWFTADGNPQFFYHKPWNRLIGYPAAFYSDTRMTDHHFHYGYYLRAAACVAQWDPEWVKPENWGGMCEMLIRDVNSWDDNDPLFGRFCYFEPYEGHGWADGTGFDRGTNQESSSEATNFDIGVLLYGVMTGNKTIRDMGIFMLTNEARAVEQYWWDVDNVTFPAAYTHTCVGMVWSNGGNYGTWFSGDKNAIHGINILPNTSGHLYYGRCPDYIPKNVTEWGNGSWSDLFWEFLAYSDGAAAMQKYNAGTGIEGGNSRPACYLEISSLNAVGRLDTVVAGDVPTYGVFTKGTIRTYCAYNPDNADRKVTFTDGYSMVVPSKKQVCDYGPVRPVQASGPVAKKSARALVSGKTYTVTNALKLPALTGDVQKIEVYTLSGKKIWESFISAGTPVKGRRIPLPAKGLYILKTFE